MQNAKVKTGELSRPVRKPEIRSDALTSESRILNPDPCSMRLHKPTLMFGKNVATSPLPGSCEHDNDAEGLVFRKQIAPEAARRDTGGVSGLFDLSSRPIAMPRGRQNDGGQKNEVRSFCPPFFCLPSAGWAMRRRWRSCDADVRRLHRLG
ncbi:MAG TPA: hypothetical protein VJ783_25740 [Pirellulales bacterium]|nr:hypothetical protein [Pirellulales bacterium]